MKGEFEPWTLRPQRPWGSPPRSEQGPSTSALVASVSWIILCWEDCSVHCKVLTFSSVPHLCLLDPSSVPIHPLPPLVTTINICRHCPMSLVGRGWRGQPHPWLRPLVVDGEKQVHPSCSGKPNTIPSLSCVIHGQLHPGDVRSLPSMLGRDRALGRCQPGSSTGHVTQASTHAPCPTRPRSAGSS